MKVLMNNGKFKFNYGMQGKADGGPSPVEIPPIASPWAITPTPIWYANTPAIDYLADNLVAGWHFEEESSEDRIDFVGGVVASDNLSNITKTIGIYNSGCGFGGVVNTKLTGPAASSLIGNAWSIALWAKWTESGSKTLIGALKQWSFPFPDGYSAFSIVINELNPGSITYTAANNDPGVTIGFPYSGGYNDGNWHFIVMTYTLNTINIYVDNVNVFINEIAPIGTTDDAPLIIGNTEAGTSPFNGTLDELMIFNKVLNSSEISSLYNGGQGTFRWNE